MGWRALLRGGFGTFRQRAYARICPTNPARVSENHWSPAAREAPTGAGVISGDAYAAVAADMVDMETFAVLRACQFFSVPLIGLRGISDGAAELAHVGDWTEYLHVIDEKLADAVDRLEAAVRTGLLNP